MVGQNMANDEMNQTSADENLDKSGSGNPVPAESAEETAECGLNEEEALRLKVATLESKLVEQKDEVLRARADFENSRKRMEKDKQAFVRYGLEGLLKDILPCLDSFEQATSQQTDGVGDEQLREGVTLVKKQLLEVLSKHGLIQVESEGALFDPEQHQAVRKEESGDVSEEIVGEVYQQGFKLHDRLLRPAMVSVQMPKG